MRYIQVARPPHGQVNRHTGKQQTGVVPKTDASFTGLDPSGRDYIQDAYLHSPVQYIHGQSFTVSRLLANLTDRLSSISCLSFRLMHWFSLPTEPNSNHVRTFQTLIPKTPSRPPNLPHCPPISRPDNNTQERAKSGIDSKTRGNQRNLSGFGVAGPTGKNQEQEEGKYALADARILARCAPTKEISTCATNPSQDLP